MSNKIVQYQGLHTHDNRYFTPDYGKAELIAPQLYRITAANITSFTQTGTNSFCLVDESHCILIDPGPILDSHLVALKDFFKKHPLTHILVTHTHIDHSPLTQILLPLYPHTSVYGFAKHPSYDPNSAFRNSGDYNFNPDYYLKDGQRLVLGSFVINVLHTPGHLCNHLAFALPQYKAILCGDLIMANSSTLVAPPDGNMYDYMCSLKKIYAYKDIDVLHPAHGPPIFDPYGYCKKLMDHREKRERQILTIMQGEKNSTLQELFHKMYKGLPKKLETAATLTILAHLQKLCLEQQIAYDQKSKQYSFLEHN